MSGKDLIERWFQRVWIDADLAAIDEMFSSRSRAAGLMEFEVTATDFEALVPAFLALVDHVDVSIPRIVEQGDWVSALVIMRARAVVGSAPLIASGQVMARIEDGKFAEVYNTVDFLSFFEQVGLLPKDTLALCLAGEAIGI